MSHVYTLRHPATGLYYIGSTDNFPNRKSAHMSRLRKGNHHNDAIQEAFNVDGGIEWETISVESKTHAMELEKEMIITNKDDPNLVNKRHAKLVDEDTRQRMSQGHRASMTPERRAAMSERATGKTHSEATKLKIGMAFKGIAPSDDALRKAAEVNSKNVIVDGVFYRTASEAAVALNVHVSTVLNRARNPRSTWDNWQLVDGGVL